MKLIRLTTTDPNCTFDNIFNDDLVIKKDSKIALLSLALETKAEELTIDSSNDTIQYQILASEGTVSTTLTHGLYNKDNFRNLFESIKNELNQVAGVDTFVTTNVYTKYYGLEWQCVENTKNEVTIKYEKGGYGEYQSDWTYDNTKVERTAGGIWRQLAGQPNDNTNNRNAVQKYYIANGCGFVRARTNIYNTGPTPASPEDNGYIIGLSRTNLSDKSGVIPTNAQLSYGISVSYDATGAKSYYIVEDGVLTLSATTPQFVSNGSTNNDVQEVIISKGQIELRVFQNGAATSQTLAAFVHTPGEKLYPFIIFRGADVDLNSLRLTPSPYSGANTNSNDSTLGTPPRPQVPPIPSKNMLNLGDSLSTFLGFDNPRIPQSGFNEVAEATYTAENQFKLLDIADSYLVELLNLKLDSYDGLKEQRKNILAVINTNEGENKITYEASNPIFIDLSNLNDLLLRNIRCRIVRNDYSLIEMKGESTLVLLIE